MSRYASDPAAVAALVSPTAVHRDVYVDEEVFRHWRERNDVPNPYFSLERD